MPPTALTWTMMAGLLASELACAGCSTSGSGSMPNYPADHPCHGKKSCDAYLKLPDGGVAAAPDGSAPPGTVLAMCGPCNG